MCEPAGQRALARLALLAALLVAITARPPPAHAAEPSAEAERLKREGFRRFAAGDHAGAVDAMERAYRAVPHPDLLFNIAAIYERWGGHCPEALDSLRRFFEVCDHCASEAAARKKEAELEARCTPGQSAPTHDASTAAEHRGSVTAAHASPSAAAEARDATTAANGAPRTTREAAADAAALGPHTCSDASDAPREANALLTPSPAPHSATLERAGWLGLGVGITAALAGTLFAVESANDASAADAALATPRTPRAVIAEHQGSATTHAILANASFGVALVAVTTGVVCLLLDGGHE